MLMYIHLTSILILLILLFEKYYTIKWLEKVGHKFENYEVMKKFVYMQRFVNYTTVASYLAVLSAMYTIIFHRLPNPKLMVLVWNQTFTITFGYWFIVFPEVIKSTDPKNYVLDIMQHCPVFLLYTYQITFYDNIFIIEDVYYSIIYGYFYLFFIWLPYYLTTGDVIYTSMNGGWKNKIITIAKINVIGVLGQMVGCYFLN